MPSAKNGSRSKRIEEALRDASWHVSHAIGLTAYASRDEVDSQWRLAAAKEERAAFILEAAGQELEAAVHRISAASCYEEVAEYDRALTLLRAALSDGMQLPYRAKVEHQFKDCLAKARKQLDRRPRKKPAPVA